MSATVAGFLSVKRWDYNLLKNQTSTAKTSMTKAYQRHQYCFEKLLFMAAKMVYFFMSAFYGCQK
ncbi:MAG: hypothetical protein EAY75_10955 [Bacteroidetes bacterium]|nr:MAG: hypothetical protein EAY75_10955 [Bacteroidota bacterium]